LYHTDTDTDTDTDTVPYPWLWMHKPPEARAQRLNVDKLT
jgi:hypothetical protein